MGGTVKFNLMMQFCSLNLFALYVIVTLNM
jgi:hypothetical protein